MCAQGLFDTSKAVPVNSTEFTDEHQGIKLVSLDNTGKYRLVVVNTGGQGQGSSQTGQPTTIGYRLAAYAAGSPGAQPKGRQSMRL